jgi:pimeloyl-ACP methyl ester carboxylesterase
MMECGSEGESIYDPSEIQIPTLVVHGSEDTIIPMQNSVELSKIIPNAELLIVKGAGHVPILTRTEEVIEAIKRVFS